MRRFVDRVLCCLPFEYDWYRTRGVAAEFVGHPFFDEVAQHNVGWAAPTNARRDNSGDGSRNAPVGGHSPPYTVAILPGSRGHEVAHNFPLQIDVMVELQRRLPGLRFLVACYKESQRAICEELLVRAGVLLPVELQVGRTSEIISTADVCLSVSGSVSLEMLARETPTVILYRITRFYGVMGRLMMTCKYISLPNLIADRVVMPEFVSWGNSTATSAAIVELLHRWLTDNVERDRVVADLRQVKSTVAAAGATARAAEAILEHLPARTTSRAA